MKCLNRSKQKVYWEGLKCLNQALLIYKEVTSPVQQALTQMNIGCIYMYTGREEESLYLYQSAEKIFRQSHDRYKLGLLYNNMGCAYYKLHQLETAEKFYDLSIDFCSTYKSLVLDIELTS